MSILSEAPRRLSVQQEIPAGADETEGVVLTEVSLHSFIHTRSHTYHLSQGEVWLWSIKSIFTFLHLDIGTRPASAGLLGLRPCSRYLLVPCDRPCWRRLAD